MQGEEVRLTIWLKDGRVFSGVYHYLAALARLDFAKQHPLFSDFAFFEVAR